jgi:hypothetical protein
MDPELGPVGLHPVAASQVCRCTKSASFTTFEKATGRAVQVSLTSQSKWKTTERSCCSNSPGGTRQKDRWKARIEFSRGFPWTHRRRRCGCRTLDGPRQTPLRYSRLYAIMVDVPDIRDGFGGFQPQEMTRTAMARRTLNMANPPAGRCRLGGFYDPIYRVN